MPKKDNSIMVSLKMTRHLFVLVDEVSEISGVSKSELTRRALVQFLDGFLDPAIKAAVKKYKQFTKE